MSRIDREDLHYTGFCCCPQVEGNVFTVYNVGTQDLPLGEVAVKVNDNNYHIVRFTRTGANATLQIDDYNVQTVTSIGKMMG